MTVREHSIYIGNLVNIPGHLYLIGNFDSLPERNEKSFEIKIKMKKPKKVNRKCVFYVEEDYDINTVTLLYINEKTGDCFNKNISVLEKDDAYVFDLLDFLNQENIPFTLPEAKKISFDTKLWMIYDAGGYYPCSFGVQKHHRETGIALDGTGSGNDYYLYRDYLTFENIGIRRLETNSRNLEPISKDIEFFLKNHKPGEVSREEFDHLLRVMCQGNEIGIQTDTIYVCIYRHYRNEIDVTIGDKKLVFENYKGDILQERYKIKEEDMPALKKAEQWYVQLIKKLIDCKTEDEVKQCFKE